MSVRCVGAFAQHERIRMTRENDMNIFDFAIKMLYSIPRNIDMYMW